MINDTFFVLYGTIPFLLLSFETVDCLLEKALSIGIFYSSVPSSRLISILFLCFLGFYYFDRLLSSDCWNSISFSIIFFTPFFSSYRNFARVNELYSWVWLVSNALSNSIDGTLPNLLKSNWESLCPFPKGIKLFLVPLSND